MLISKILHITKTGVLAKPTYSLSRSMGLKLKCIWAWEVVLHHSQSLAFYYFLKMLHKAGFLILLHSRTGFSCLPQSIWLYTVIAYIVPGHNISNPFFLSLYRHLCWKDGSLFGHLCSFHIHAFEPLDSLNYLSKSWGSKCV